MIIDSKIVSVSVNSNECSSTLTVRPEMLPGVTYKIKPPGHNDAMYVTINSLDNKPFELFIQSKNAEHTQWTSALTRVISAIFRKGGDVTFLIDELKSIHDPRGGHFAHEKYVPSLVAEIGYVLEKHLNLKKEAKPTKKTCQKCNGVNVEVSGGCSICRDCGDSKCE
jgi:ribonucleoside-diphosphate reductase alpha chain